jgi:hypothetical protein
MAGQCQPYNVVSVVAQSSVTSGVKPGSATKEPGGTTMDGFRFDLIGKWLATSKSRRITLRALAAGALVVGPGRLALETASAKCVNPGKTCKSKNGKKKKCCGGVKCKGGKCQCPTGLKACGGLCVDILSDLDHCGQCGNACGGDEICKYGSCCANSGPSGPDVVCCSGIICNPPGENCVCI